MKNCIFADSLIFCISVNLPENYRRGSLEEYHVHRIMSGVPEGMDDFIPGTSLPLECNLDYMNGGKYYNR